jgi:RHS repeat-associated protein
MQRRFNQRFEVRGLASLLAVLTALPACGGGGHSSGSDETIERYRKPPKEPTLADEPPVGAPVTGTLAGNLSVGPTGAAIYTVPIAVPPGVAGVAPNLSLVYNSQGGDGVAGQGWELAGLSTIHRCPRTRIQDGAARPVMLDSASVGDAETMDGVCLDGQRLFEDPIGSGKFRLARTDFSEISRIADGGFQVRTKSGELRRYGASSTSRIEFRISQGVAAAAWLLDRVQDAWGNYFDVVYNDGTSDFVSRGILPTEIAYTGHVATSASASEVAPFFHVKLSYEARDDVRTVRFGSFALSKSQRLKTITTDRGSYELAYKATELATAGLPSRLETITYCASDAERTCLEPLRFGWTYGFDFWRAETPAYALPSQIPVGEKLHGTQFVDLDGDGRSDLVFGLEQLGDGSRVTGSWRNSGHGWDYERSLAPPPTPLAAKPTNGKRAGALGVVFADMDGDGLPDLVRDSADVTCTDSYTCQACPLVGTCAGQKHHASPAVWLNRFRGDRRGWEYHAEFEARPKSGDFTGDVTFIMGSEPSGIADMDGDGRADLVRVFDNAGPSTGDVVSIAVMLNRADGWKATTRSDLSVSGTDHLHPFHLQDVNRDGLPDVVRQSLYVYPDRRLRSTDQVAINRGPVTSGSVTTIAFNSVTGTTAPAGGTDVASTDDDVAPKRRPRIGDLDGDGLYDALMYYPTGKRGEKEDEYALGVALGTGSNLGFNVAGGDAYASVLQGLSPKPSATFPIDWPADYGTAVVDANGDGLVDLVRFHSPRPGFVPSAASGGQLLLNTGTTWRDPFGAMTWQVPVKGTPVPAVPDEANVDDGSAFIDLNGDGLTDIIQEGKPGHAWLNSYRPPVIETFPHLRAQPTVVDYTVITSEEAQAGAHPTYSDGAALAKGMTYLTTPLRVVRALTEDTGAGNGVTTYRYANLRASALGYGPQGFESMTVTDPSGTVTTTRFAQAYPYTGLPISVARDNQGPVASTETTYCLYNVDAPHPEPCLERPAEAAAYGPRPSLFPRPIRVLDRTYLRSSFPETAPAVVQTATASSFDGFGNLTRTSVTILGLGETHTTTTVNTYGASGSAEEKMGKPTRTEVTTDGVAHVTEFAYTTEYGALALYKKMVERGAPVEESAEVHTVYGYDRFGNVTATTTCASAFADCELGNAGPDTLPFRTTTVSYDPDDLPRGVARPAYGVGRFPVMTTNAKGQSEHTVYDPLLGEVVRTTGPNGIPTCYGYDRFGQLTSETARCGTAHELTTTVARFAPVTDGLAKVVAVARPRGGSPTWTYTDAVGRTIETQALGVGGGIVETRTEYDRLGQVVRSTNPYLASREAPAWTTTTYDPIGRPVTVTQELGLLGDEWTGATAGASVARMTYQAVDPAIAQGVARATILTERTVNGEVRRRYETKNVIGKLIAVTDAAGQTISYGYDGDGNLTDTTDPAGNVVHVDHDRRGRKVRLRDPDLGEWRYIYNGFGELTQQTDAKGQTTTMTYDVLGRMVTSTDARGTAEWVYDVAGGAGIGKLAAMVSAPEDRLTGVCAIPFVGDGFHRAGRSFTYTDFGEVETASECPDGETFVTSYEYDELGRQRTVKYPAVGGSRFSVGYHYTKLGALHYVSDKADDAVLWAADGFNGVGQVIAEHTGNGVDTASQVSSATGWLLGRQITAHAGGDRSIQSWAYRFDEAGNLRRRMGAGAASDVTSDETFTYDTLDRLSGVQGTAPSRYVESYGYDALGNVTEKASVAYGYSGCHAGPHAVCSVGGSAPFSYDANGNMTSGGGRTVAYNAANRPVRIEAGVTRAVDFVYGADGHRVVQLVTADQVTARTVYVGLGATGKSLYERTTRGGSVEHTQFLYAGGAHGGSAFAARVMTDTAKPALRYYHFDHLGSITAISDEQGHVVDGAAGGRNPGVLSYDAWGARRASASQPADPAAYDLPPGHREYTGHETIPGVGLVNMNGRVYDPMLGRFLSPDPNIQAATDLQSYNRYSYVLNNPLRFTDPTGYFFSGWFDFGVSLAITGLSVAVCAGTSGVGCGVAFMIAATAYNVASAKSAGAGWDQIIASTALGVATGGIAGAWGSAAGGPVGSMLVGALGATVASTLTTVAAGGSLSDVGRNALIAAGSAAASAGVAYAVQSQIPVSKASAAEARGGGGSGAAQIEKVETLDSVLADAGVTGNGTTDSDLLNRKVGDAGDPQASVDRGSVKDADKLNTLRRGFRERATRVVNRMVDEGYDVRVVWGRRTPEENQVLVEKGLASPASKHLTGDAVDLINRADPYPDDPATRYYLDLRDAVKKEGLVWGGDCWGNCNTNRWDPTHFEAP